MSEGPPLCVNCANYQKTWIDYDQRQRGPDRCMVQAQSLVHGELGEPTCEFSRSQSYLCGYSGTLFRPLPNLKPLHDLITGATQ